MPDNVGGGSRTRGDERYGRPGGPVTSQARMGARFISLTDRGDDFELMLCRAFGESNIECHHRRDVT